MMKIMKASAGSGKTYNLARTYLGLLKERFDYRHILAVTFTNKATAEMKARILKDLSEKAKTDPVAGEFLVDILHDYSAFAISTIDKFFQQALKAFAREIGQFSSYQIELDRDSLINEAMDRILDSLTEDKTDLVNWLKESVSEQLEQGKKLEFEKALYEIGKRLKSEEHRELKELYSIDDEKAFSKERLESIRKECRRICADFVAKVRAEAENAANTIDKPKAREYVLRYLDAGANGAKVEFPKITVRKACEGTAFMELFEEPFRVYNTARMISGMLYSLGLAGEFYREFDNLLKEKNLMCLDDSNTILRDIINGSDAPFVYEKLGVRYQNFLLDEFQDTSNIQWKNFLPLLKESDSNHHDCLIVGDVKQSIYRWRDSDWKLLAEKVYQEFPDSVVTTLDGNWRSCRSIVEFNNAFFRYASALIGERELYGDVQQKVNVKDDQQGSVEVTFCDKTEELDAVLGSVAKARAAGAGWGDIAILVRNRKDGSDVADFLISNKIPVISDDSLSMKSSVTIRRLVALLSCMENPQDSVSCYLASSMDMELPEYYHSLVDLCEELLRAVRKSDEKSFEGETLFIQAFMDEVRAWSDLNGNNLREFLKHWNESDLSIGSPESSAAVRVMTVHKSKGLEFPYVIFPFAEKVELFKPGWHWCHLNTEGTALSHVLDGIYPVNLSKTDAPCSLFSEDLERETRMQAVDNINIFYVALTRPSCGLHIIAASPPENCRKAVGNGTFCRADASNFSKMLFAFCKGQDEWQSGSMYDFSRLKRGAGQVQQPFPASYPSIELGNRLSPSEDALDYFGDDGVVGVSASPRLNGIVLHSILSSVHGPDDLEAAVSYAVMSGLIDEVEGRRNLEMLKVRIASHSSWFESDCLNEVTLIDTDGELRRPDRVVFADGTVTVIDYKFGEEKKSYLYQVRRYMDIYRRMGYDRVQGAVWYVPEDRVVAI